MTKEELIKIEMMGLDTEQIECYKLLDEDEKAKFLELDYDGRGDYVYKFKEKQEWEAKQSYGKNATSMIINNLPEILTNQNGEIENLLLYNSTEELKTKIELIKTFALLEIEAGLDELLRYLKNEAGLDELLK